MDSLIHVIYVSVAKQRFSPAALQELLEVARRKNASLDVTGMLLFVDETFFQVLEGPEAVVLPLLARIAEDPRHDRVLKLIQEPIEHRAFADWTMGHAAISNAEFESIPGFNDFFQSGKHVIDLPAGRARSLLDAFASGRWRASILG